jgi:hypothetical protein
MDSEQKAISRRHLVAFPLIGACVLGGLYAGDRGYNRLGGFLLLAAMIIGLVHWVSTFPRSVRYLWRRFLK